MHVFIRTEDFFHEARADIALPGLCLVQREARRCGVAARSRHLLYSDAVFAYSEKFSRDPLGYEPKQILLLHANQLEAEHVQERLELSASGAASSLRSKTH
jgi:hypothetical protein